VGDDINDLEVMKAVGFSACPADALNEIKTIASVILTKVGGGGCIREFLDDWF
jgi:3-deoxy-D-manno-octulosonate 8-phosphate phosphatase (KDO 8-P phosphatase)